MSTRARRSGGAVKHYRESDTVALGTSVCKHFPGHGWFRGKVTCFDAEQQLYTVVYEDGDEEEYDEDELKEILEAGTNDAGTMITPTKEIDRGDSKAASVITPSPQAASLFMTPEKRSSSSSSIRSRKIQKIAVVTPAASDKTSENSDFLEQEEYASLEYTEPVPPRRKSTTRTVKKKTSATERSARKSKKNETMDEEFLPDDDESLSTEEEDDDEKVSANKSPRKKKATTTPRKTPRKAQKATSDTPSRSANANATSSRSVVKWGLPRGALVKCPHSGFTVRALDSIPPNPRPSHLLPGRLMVVAADDNGVCPADFCGRVFDSAQDLHEAISARHHDDDNDDKCPEISLATYAMEAVSDPAFASWEFAMARLSSVGLVQDDKFPVLQVQINWDGGTQISGQVTYWQGPSATDGSDDSLLQWAFVEGDELNGTPPVLLGAPRTLLEYRNDKDMASTRLDITDSDLESDASESVDGSETNSKSIGSPDEDLVPQPTNMVSARIKLAASLLQKSIRRGRKLCSPTPLLEASMELLHPTKSCSGSTFAFLKTLWACMLVDVSPFDESSDCLGLGGALLLSLIARVDPTWAMPFSLRRCAVASALRTAQCDQTQQWIGFMKPNDGWFNLEEIEVTTAPQDVTTETETLQRAANVRNILRVSQAVAGGNISWGKWNKFIGETSTAAILSYLNHRDWNGTHLPAAPRPDPKEASFLNDWEKGIPLSLPTDHDKQHLDEQVRLAAIEPTVIPQSLVLLQAVLERPPTKWKKHSLPSLSRQVRKLVSEANPRFRERAQLARLQTWGKDKAAPSAVTAETPQGGLSETKAIYKSFREVVTPTGMLSDGETALVNCFESIQRWQLNRFRQEKDAVVADPATPAKNIAAVNCRVTTGPPLSERDGRIAFLLAFASAIEVDVDGEVVSVMFAGDSDEPLLVQRIGKARTEGRELATGGGSTSGATAVPSLGYVQRNRSAEEAKLVEGAERAVAAYWKGGRKSALPLPPPGFQWEVSGTSKNSPGWDDAEPEVERTVELDCDEKGVKSWRFSIGGTTVLPFDARPVISPCALDIDDMVHLPIPLENGSNFDRHLRTALYAPVCSNENGTSRWLLPQGEEVLKVFSELHSLAVTARTEAPNEGMVYDWIPLAGCSLLPARAWRDALLAIRTRDSDQVILAKGIRPNGTGAPRDMTEGVLVRVFHALECLYPMTLRKDGALRFRVRARGGAYHHLLCSLERLGRGELLQPNVLPHDGAISTLKRSVASLVSNPALHSSAEPIATEEQAETGEPLSKRPRRRAAMVASQKFAMQSNAGQLIAEESLEKDGAFKMSELDSKEDVAHVSLKGRGAPLPRVTTALWAHQETSVCKVVQGVKEGRRGHADASAVGAGKTLTALAVIVRLAEWIQKSGKQRYGTLVMLPTKALIREWLLEVATHTKGFHVIEQREDGSLFSLTYSKSNPPIDCNALIITTLDRVCRHPFVRQTAWDFVCIDECLSVQNADAKRNPSAWRQIEISTCGVLMLSATFFRSKYDALFYMIRMLRSPLPRTMEWLPATIHEHIVCQIPETGRTWHMRAEMAPLQTEDLAKYRGVIESFRRRQLNDPGQADGRKLWKDLESFLRQKYEGRASRTSYASSSVMGMAFARLAKSLLRKKRRPLVFADTSNEANFILRALKASGMKARTWADIATQNIAGMSNSSANHNMVIVAVKSIEGQGINMQRHADTIICRPTPGDHLEQMKGRIDRPGQTAKELHLHVVVCEHTIEECKYSNIRLAGNFFREYIAPVATRYRERIDLEATLAAGGTGRLKRGTVSGAWKRSLEAAGQTGCFASVDFPSLADDGGGKVADEECWKDEAIEKVASVNKQESVPKDKTKSKYKPLNKVIRNRGDPKAVAEAKALARKGGVSAAVKDWLFPTKTNTATMKGKTPGVKPLKKDSLLRFSDRKPALVLDRETVQSAVVHLTKNDPKLGSLIARVGVDALCKDCGGTPKPPTQARLFDRCVRAITFTMVSVDAGNAFMRRLSIKIGVCLESISTSRRNEILAQFLADLQESGDAGDFESPEELLQVLLQGGHNEILFTPSLVGELVKKCEVLNGKKSGYPHLCGVTFPCGKNDNPEDFLEKARAFAKGGKDPVSAGFSAPKASFIVSLVDDFAKGRISGEKIANASDREAAKMLCSLKGIGDWCAGGILMHFLSRADILIYGDLTVRNYLNDLYDINHHDASETLLESAADFPDNGPNRNLIDEVAKKNGWTPYRSVVCYLMYHLQEENLVLL